MSFASISKLSREWSSKSTFSRRSVVSRQSVHRRLYLVVAHSRVHGGGRDRGVPRLLLNESQSESAAAAHSRACLCRGPVGRAPCGSHMQHRDGWPNSTPQTHVPGPDASFPRNPRPPVEFPFSGVAAVAKTGVPSACMLCTIIYSND